MDAKIIDKIRFLIDEIKTADNESRFTDEQIWNIYEDYTNVNKTTSEFWYIKAGMFQRELGEIDEYSAGNEKYKYVNLTTAINAAFKMAQKYNDSYMNETRENVSAFLLKVKPPDVM